MAQLEVIEGGAVLIGDDGRVSQVGRYSEIKHQAGDASVQEVAGVLFPGLVDAHTHAVFGAARLADHERRAKGMDYKTIASEGGGILSSVRDTRERSYDNLLDLSRRRLTHLLRQGTTTVEIKSGYGLDMAVELRQLEVIRQLAQDGAPAVVPTFLGAHEIPMEFRARRKEYVELVTQQMIPAAAEQGVARFCDIFCEPGVFTADESRLILQAARAHGMELKMHADELDGAGGAELAVELGAVSADHLARVSDAGIAALAGSDTVAVLLPGTQLFLGRSDRAPARRMVDAGCAVALATDFNPGSSPCMSLPLIGMLGVSQLGLTPAEAVTAITANGAAAVAESASRGQIAPGFRGDLVLAAIDDWRELVYWYGGNLVREAWVAGVSCRLGQLPVNSVV
jgi:imidazolonepropionase